MYNSAHRAKAQLEAVRLHFSMLPGMRCLLWSKILSATRRACLRLPSRVEHACWCGADGIALKGAREVVVENCLVERCDLLGEQLLFPSGMVYLHTRDRMPFPQRQLPASMQHQPPHQSDERMIDTLARKQTTTRKGVTQLRAPTCCLRQVHL